MQATKTVKKQSKWQALWRRLRRRTPFWQQRLEDRTDGELEPAGLLEHIGRAASDAVDLFIALFLGALAVSVITSVVIAPIFLSPDFMTVGLADPIGRGLAAVCLSTGQCDPGYLLAGTSMAVLILLLLVYVVVVALRGDPDEETVSDAELVSGLSVLDERVVRLRADMVLAGLLPLSREEAQEIAGDFVANATPDERAAFYDRAAKLLRGQTEEGPADGD